MSLFLVIACLSILPAAERTSIAHDTVDLAEVNHFHDEQGRLVFDQIIFYDWSHEHSRYQVRAWRMLNSPSQIPQKNFVTGRYEVIWHDGDITRRVEARAFRESWTQHDVEMTERQHLPKEQRRKLTTPRVTTNQGD